MGMSFLSAHNAAQLFGGDAQLFQQDRLVEIKMALKQLAWKYEETFNCDVN